MSRPISLSRPRFWLFLRTNLPNSPTRPQFWPFLRMNRGDDRLFGKGLFSGGSRKGGMIPSLHIHQKLLQGTKDMANKRGINV